MTRGRMVTQLRKYSIIDVQAAKEVAMVWLEQAQLQNAVTFGLPEVDDRYHVWRVPLLNQTGQERIGEVVIDARTDLNTPVAPRDQHALRPPPLPPPTRPVIAQTTLIDWNSPTNQG
ncbi:hypothetical protein [Candidatus Amarolinea dominans]|uniref:hypothetical protein n=1 Tax=Candidatus Amarolinea dominans TaxID=3140696 RepID=UPI0031371CA3|nr:hypothetical protein [Anaerolineae bacterium]